MVALGVQQMPKGIPLTPEDIQERRRMIAQEAVQLFVHKGFNETSMRQIARMTGMGKSTLYDYFPSKDDIIVFVLERHLADVMSQAHGILAQPVSAAEKLRAVMKMHLAFLLRQKSFYLRLMLEAQRLKAESQQRIQEKRYAFQDMLKNLIEQGIKEGSFREVDSTMAMKTLISMMTPVVFTTRPSGTPEQMLDWGLDLVLNGLAA
jgi:AcrR family transcriptional regulator